MLDKNSRKLKLVTPPSAGDEEAVDRSSRRFSCAGFAGGWLRDGASNGMTSGASTE
jgi:hypothetical protein